MQEVRRSWAALRSGKWEINELLDNWQLYVARENQWRVRRHERYQAVGVDITDFWRPRLEGWVGKHYHSLAGKALPAVVIGVNRHCGRGESPSDSAAAQACAL